MKVIYFHQRTMMDKDMVWGFLELGYEDFVTAQERVPDAEYTENDVENILKELGDAELVITKDFSAATAEACHRKERIYLSWVHDAPQRSLYMKEALYETNIIFVFDKLQFGRMQALGIPHVFHQPLAANLTRVTALTISEDDIARYRSDCSFVGNFYDSKQRELYFASLPEDVRKKAKQMIHDRIGHWGKTHYQYPELDDATVDAMYRIMSTANLELYNFDRKYLIETVLLAGEIAMRERLIALELLAKHMKTVMYTGHPDEAETYLPNVTIRGYVDYETEMPKVFYASKINLNLTLPTIETGIPLRVFDIMSVGGFVMSNYQEEAAELFVPDEEIVLFYDFAELLEKARFYLSHDDARQRIAIRGYQRVSRDYTVPQAVARMLSKTKEVFGG